MTDEALRPDDARELVLARLEAGAWWCVPSVSVAANALAYDLMRAYYRPGPDSGVWCWSPPANEARRGAVAVSLFRRRELPLPELARALKPGDDPQTWVQRANLEHGLAASPFVFLPEADSDEAWAEARARAAAFLSWLGWPATTPGAPTPAPQE